MHKRVRDIVTYAESIGFHLIGQDGSEHYVLRHRKGDYRIPSTPGDWRGDLNAKAALRRIAGAKHDGPNHRRSRKACRPSGYRPERTDEEQRRGGQIEALNARWHEVTARLNEMAADPHRSDMAEARELIAEQVRIEEALTDLHQPVPRSAS